MHVVLAICFQERGSMQSESQAARYDGDTNNNQGDDIQQHNK
jgi:hypothetical protein